MNKIDIEPKVSIIIPLYNREKLIKRAIESVLVQSFTDFELIIVDDCSSDESAKVVHGINDERIIYIKHECNKGANAARNTAIKLARGKYIAFQDSDDEWLPNKLEKQMTIIENSSNKVGCVYTGFWRYENNSKRYIPEKWVRKFDGDILSEVLKGNFISTQTMLIKTECIKTVGLFDEKLPRLQDWELVIRLAQEYEFAYVNEGLVNVYHTQDSITSNSEKLRIAYNMIIDKNNELFLANKKILAKHYIDIALSFYVDKQYLKMKQYLKKAIQTYPYKIDFLMFYIVSLCGKSILEQFECFFLKK